jgi:hypothetical protein
MRAVAEVCSEWAALQQDDLVAVYLAFLDSCHRRTLEVASAQSGSLEYRPSGDKSLVAVVGIDRSPGLIDLRECPAQSLDETLITAMEESIPRQVYAAVGARIVDLVSRGIVDADSLGAAVEDGAQALDFATLRQLASTDLTAAQHATLASFPTLRRGGIVPTLFDERSECLLAADHARAGLLAQWRRSLAAALAGVAKRKVMSGQALLSSDLSAKQDSLPMVNTYPGRRTTVCLLCAHAICLSVGSSFARIFCLPALDRESAHGLRVTDASSECLVLRPAMRHSAAGHHAGAATE